MIAVVDLGVMAVGSWVNLLSSLGHSARVCREPGSLGDFDTIVFPGVGNFSRASHLLDQGGWRKPLISGIEEGKKFLGVCLGMQLLGESSGEGEGRGLGVLAYSSQKFDPAAGARVPHMGWNTVEWGESFELRIPDAEFYFTHSYGVLGETPWTAGITDNGVRFTSVVSLSNVLGVQFHPEKSHGFGRQLVSSFLERPPLAKA